MVDPDWQHHGQESSPPPRPEPPPPPRGGGYGGGAMPPGAPGPPVTEPRLGWWRRLRLRLRLRRTRRRRRPPRPDPPQPPSPSTWHRDTTGGDELVDLAYEAAKAKLDSQTSAFESLRTRAAGILSVAALVTSFSTGLGLVNTDPAQGRPLAAWAPWALLGILLALGLCAFRILMPTRQWLHGPSARIIMNLWQEGMNPKEAKVNVTAAMVDAQRQNSKELGKRSWAYRLAVLLLLGQVLTLGVAIAQSSAD